MRPSRNTPRSNCASTRCTWPPNFPLVLPPHERQRVGKLPAPSAACPAARGTTTRPAGSGTSAGRRGDRRDGVVEVAEADAERVHRARRQHARPRAQHRSGGDCATAWRCDADPDGAIERARRDVVLTLASSSEPDVVARRSHASRARTVRQQIVERRRRERAADRPRRPCRERRPARRRPDCGPRPRRTRTGVWARSGPAERERHLLAVERRIPGESGRASPAAPATPDREGRRRPIRADVAARARHHVDDRSGRPAELRREPVRRDLEFLHGILRDVLQRPADHIVVVVHPVDGDVAAAAGLAGRRHDDRLRLGRIEVRRAGALPGVRNASSRKLRPLSGSDSISPAEITEPTTDLSTSTVPASPATVSCSSTADNCNGTSTSAACPTSRRTPVTRRSAKPAAETMRSMVPGGRLAIAKKPSASARLSRVNPLLSCTTRMVAGTPRPWGSITRPRMDATAPGRCAATGTKSPTTSNPRHTTRLMLIAGDYRSRRRAAAIIRIGYECSPGAWHGFPSLLLNCQASLVVAMEMCYTPLRLA